MVSGFFLEATAIIIINNIIPPKTQAHVGTEVEFTVVVVVVLLLDELEAVSCATEIKVVRPSIIKRKIKM